jgi:hypothetical protein
MAWEFLYFVDFRESEPSRLYSSPWNRAKGTNRQRANDAAFLGVELFAAIVIALPAISFHLARPARMKWKPLPVGVAFERPNQQLANPHDGE